VTATRPTVTLIIPALNEVEAIGAVLKDVPRDVVDDVLVVDGHSTDGTPDLVRRLGYRVVEQDGHGYGAAIATGFRHARGDVAVLADADGSYTLDDIRRLLDAVAGGADVALGSRYRPESGSDDDTWVRRVGNALFTLLLRRLFGVPTSDALFFYAALRRRVFESVTASSTGFEYIVEFLIRAHRAGFSFAEIPSAERRRTAGRSKVNALLDGLRLLRVMGRELLGGDAGRPRR
jgi:glycosyltransferase involved in cell wall biosynthesis